MDICSSASTSTLSVFVLVDAFVACDGGRRPRSSLRCALLKRVHTEEFIIPRSLWQGLAYMGHLNAAHRKKPVGGSILRGATLSMVEFSKQLDKIQAQKRCFTELLAFK